MAVPFTFDPDATYATKVNIKFPGTQAAATAAEAATVTKFADRAPSGVAVTVAGGTIKLAT